MMKKNAKANTFKTLGETVLGNRVGKKIMQVAMKGKAEQQSKKKQ